MDIINVDMAVLEVKVFTAYQAWVDELKELGGWYEQPDELFYTNCWLSGLTPKAVSDYLNQPLER